MTQPNQQRNIEDIMMNTPVPVQEDEQQGGNDQTPLGDEVSKQVQEADKAKVKGQGFNRTAVKTELAGRFCLAFRNDAGER